MKLLRILLILFLWITVGVFLILLSMNLGCGSSLDNIPVPIKVVTVPEHVPCLSTSPPSWMHVGSPSECVPDSICFSRDQFAILVGDIEEIKIWAKNAWTLCR